MKRNTIKYPHTHSKEAAREYVRLAQSYFEDMQHDLDTTMRYAVGAVEGLEHLVKLAEEERDYCVEYCRKLTAANQSMEHVVCLLMEALFMYATGKSVFVTDWNEQGVKPE